MCCLNNTIINASGRYRNIFRFKKLSINDLDYTSQTNTPTPYAYLSLSPASTYYI